MALGAVKFTVTSGTVSSPGFAFGMSVVTVFRVFAVVVPVPNAVGFASVSI